MSDLGSPRISARIPARTGHAFALGRGEHVRVIDLEGAQPVDFWAFNATDPAEHLSVAHTKRAVGRLLPVTGEAAYTNRRRPIVTIVADNSPGQHDMEYPACDPTLYAQMGAPGHANCEDNLHAALAALGLASAVSPQPWNLFTNFFVNADKTVTIKAPETRAGDNIVLRAEMDAYVIVSACPQDLNPTCGGRPTDIAIEIGG